VRERRGEYWRVEEKRGKVRKWADVLTVGPSEVFQLNVR
jgi:hypothetical protein